MTTTSVSTTEEALRQAFKVLNRRLMVPLWRLGLGQWLNAWPTMSGRIMVLVHTGRKSGLRRFTPVNYAQVDGEVYCTAGFGAGSDWYKNIIANPAVEVWLPDGWWAGVAEDITGAPAALPLLRSVLIASGAAAPLAGVDPKGMSDAELAEATAPYRLLHIKRTEARTGPGGPGELAWVWPLTTLLLLPLLLRRKR